MNVNSVTLCISYLVILGISLVFMSLISGNEETLWQYQVSNETKVWSSPAWIHWNWRKFLYLEDKTTSRYWISGSTESLEMFFRINVFKMLEIMVRLLLLLMMKSIMVKIMIRYWEFWYHAAAVAGLSLIHI